MDALANLLRDVRSEGSIFGRNILAPPWSLRFADGARLTMLVLLSGECWIVPDGGTPVALEAGGVAIVLGPEPFAVADEPTASAPPLYIMHGPGDCSTATGEPITDDIHLGVRTCGPGLDGPITLITGSYQVRGRVSERLLRSLPRVIVVPHEGELCAVLELTSAEIAREAPGQQAVLDRLLDLLLLTALREWFGRPEAQPPAWYQASTDPVVGPALRAIHDNPATPWTVAELAAVCDVSRAGFSRRFTELLGEPPMSYLTGWRLSLAADLLQSTDATVDSVARQVGYANAFALSVAFKRVHGTRPSEFRTLIRVG